MKRHLNNLAVLWAVLLVMLVTIATSMTLTLVAFQRIHNGQVQRRADQQDFNKRIAAAVAGSHDDLCAGWAGLPIGTTPQATYFLHAIEAASHCPLTSPLPFVPPQAP